MDTEELLSPTWVVSYLPGKRVCMFTLNKYKWPSRANQTAVTSTNSIESRGSVGSMAGWLGEWGRRRAEETQYVYLESLESGTRELDIRGFNRMQILVRLDTLITLTYLSLFQISRQSIDACKEYFRDDLIKADWTLMVELKKLFEIL